MLCCTWCSRCQSCVDGPFGTCPDALRRARGDVFLADRLQHLDPRSYGQRWKITLRCGEAAGELAVSAEVLKHIGLQCPPNASLKLSVSL